MIAGPFPRRFEDPFLLQDLDDLALLVELGEAVRADEVVLLEGRLVLGLELVEEVLVDQVVVVARLLHVCSLFGLQSFSRSRGCQVGLPAAYFRTAFWMSLRA
ncbi:MAG: hypothetical protein MZV64_49800 [Ignavibacteriales bacterium]|nr:hypothetical protein [Ignavibacteriales bacterium]